MSGIGRGIPSYYSTKVTDAQRELRDVFMKRPSISTEEQVSMARKYGLDLNETAEVNYSYFR